MKSAWRRFGTEQLIHGAVACVHNIHVADQAGVPDPAGGVIQGLASMLPMVSAAAVHRPAPIWCALAHPNSVGSAWLLTVRVCRAMAPAAARRTDRGDRQARGSRRRRLQRTTSLRPQCRPPDIRRVSDRRADSQPSDSQAERHPRHAPYRRCAGSRGSRGIRGSGNHHSARRLCPQATRQPHRRRDSLTRGLQMVLCRSLRCPMSV